MFRKYVSTVFILIGLSLIAFSIFKVSKWHFQQEIYVNKILSYGSPTIDLSDSPTITSPITAIKVNKEEEITITRDQYENGTMAVIIPKINVQAAVIDGTDKVALKKGPGLYDLSDMPNEHKGNVSIAAHNDSWFKNIHKLTKGDTIELFFEKTKYIYTVDEVSTIESNDWSVINTTEKPTITLTTCHPITGNLQRLIVRGSLTNTTNN